MTDIFETARSQSAELKCGHVFVAPVLVISAAIDCGGDPSPSMQPELREAGPATCYTVERVPNPAAEHAPVQQFVDLDEHGRVLFNTMTADFETDRAYLWSGGEPQPIDVGSSSTSALAMNNRGAVLGIAWREDLEQHQAFVWKDGEVQAWIALPPENNWADQGWIDDRGRAVLRLLVGDAPFRAQTLLWDGAEVHDLGLWSVDAVNETGELAGFDAERGELVKWRWEQKIATKKVCRSGEVWEAGMRINRHGQVAASLLCDGKEEEFFKRDVLWSGDEVSDLPDLRGSHTRFMDLNDRGEVLGVVDEDGGPVLWRDDELIELSLPPGIQSVVATDVNNHGVITGFSYAHALLVGDADGLFELPRPKLPFEGYEVPGAINDHGVIVHAFADDIFATQDMRVFQWRPGCDPDDA
ncbi:hypothetical protein [Nannocystis bainbridge]|uniref:Uncharacterized protein n=1 Tax=Nannocystis bainbridge TaxID=2995303 RepID=A0ABT5DSZ0_9BACT|nr:hypothetical protein [Nannocystis bainbridge]MDC0716184.1 hypothetical protein [Nannocystis bainbridge]